MVSSRPKPYRIQNIIVQLWNYEIVLDYGINCFIVCFIYLLINWKTGTTGKTGTIGKTGKGRWGKTGTIGESSGTIGKNGKELGKI